MKLRRVVLFFTLCALFDFAWNYFQRRSLIEGVISAVFGLFGSAWYLLFFWPFWSEKREPRSSEHGTDNP
jgi:hypothetical protein